MGLVQALGSVPSENTYSDAGVSGVTPANLNAINDALASAVVNGAKADTPAKLQAIVDAYNKVIAAADGNSVNNTSGAALPGATDYAALGVTAVDAGTAALLGDVIDNLASAEVDTVAKLQALADAAKTVLAYDNASTDTAPTVAQLNSLVSGVTDANLAAVLHALEAANGGAQAINQSGLQTLVDNITQALSHISAAATNNSAVSGALTPTTYAIAGVTGVSASNVGLVNQMLDSVAIDGSAVDSALKLQSLVDALAKIRSLADGTDGTGAPLNNADITALGLIIVKAIGEAINADFGVAASPEGLRELKGESGAPS
jgi:hypothetical protein